jgi:hypothetical protein
MFISLVAFESCWKLSAKGGGRVSDQLLLGAVMSCLKLLKQIPFPSFYPRRCHCRRCRRFSTHYYVRKLRCPITTRQLAFLRQQSLSLNILCSGWLDTDDDPVVDSTYSSEDVSKFLSERDFFSGFLTYSTLITSGLAGLYQGWHASVDSVAQASVAVVHYNDAEQVDHSPMVSSIPPDLPTKYFEKYTEHAVYKSSPVSSEDYLPIVLDTGASTALTPIRKDFIGDLQEANTPEIRGISSALKVMGTGTIEWDVRDFYGVTRKIFTEALYVPGATIRLFSPQQYFRIHGAGDLYCDKDYCRLCLADGQEMTFPYDIGCRLPLMLPSQGFSLNLVGFAKEEVRRLHELVHLSVADVRNENLTNAEKELLLWHFRFGHCDMARVQSLFAQPQSRLGVDDLGRRDSFLEARYPSMSGLRSPLPVCAACKLSNMARVNPVSSSRMKHPGETKLLSAGKVRPGARVSVDQYISGLPGRLPNTYGKEPAKDRYHGGTLFVDHCSGFVFIRHQVSLASGETIHFESDSLSSLLVALEF